MEAPGPGNNTYVLRRLTTADLTPLQASMPSWNAREYEHRLNLQDRGLVVQLISWADGVAVGRGMVLFPGHPDWSVSAHRERCAEVRDVETAESWRGRGVARAVVAGLEAEARSAGWDRVGLSVGVEEPYAAARALYEHLGYRFAHGPFVSGAALTDDDGKPFGVAGVCTYSVKDL